MFAIAWADDDVIAVMVGILEGGVAWLNNAA